LIIVPSGSPVTKWLARVFPDLSPRDCGAVREVKKKRRQGIEAAASARKNIRKEVFSMAEKDKITSFIQQLYGENKARSISRDDIVSHASSNVFPADVEILFKELPEESFDERKLIDNLNSIISRRNRIDAIGGKIEL
jgi:hypothetical protein